jgi:hypothetical protein
MELSFFPLTLEAVDQAAAESLCLFIGADERPLTGLAGLADWRLSGRLSRLLRSGALTGTTGEAVLTPPGARLGFKKLFVFGLGTIGQDESALAQQVGEGLRKIAQAGVQEAALQLPPRLSPEAGIAAILSVAEDESPLARAMVFSSEPAKLMAALSQAASRGRAQYERRVVKVQAPGTKPAATPPRRPAIPEMKTLEPEPAPPAAAEVPIAPALPDSTPPPPTAQTAPPEEATPAPEAAPVTDAGPAEEPDAPAAAPHEGTPAPHQGAPAPHSAPPPPPGDPARKAPPAPQRYVPQAPSQNVFDRKRKKH